jgi:hypothetical protein
MIPRRSTAAKGSRTTDRQFLIWEESGYGDGSLPAKGRHTSMLRSGRQIPVTGGHGKLALPR